MYKNETIDKYLSELASKNPVPGGGSAAALVGATAAALIAKVANFTVGKEKYKDQEAEMQNILERAKTSIDEFNKLCYEDAVVYKKLSEAFKKKEKIEESLKEAARVPFEICENAHRAIKLCLPLCQKGNRNLITDSGLASLMLKCAFESALLNVEINLKSLEDADFIKKMKDSLGAMEEDINVIDEGVSAEVERYLTK